MRELTARLLVSVLELVEKNKGVHMSSMRPRDRIVANLESIYREAYERAKSSDDKDRMMDLDASFQREQLMLEVLLDVRDALAAIGDEPASERALKKINTLRNITKFAK